MLTPSLKMGPGKVGGDPVRIEDLLALLEKYPGWKGSFEANNEDLDALVPFSEHQLQFSKKSAWTNLVFYSVFRIFFAFEI